MEEMERFIFFFFEIFSKKRGERGGGVLTKKKRIQLISQRGRERGGGEG